MRTDTGRVTTKPYADRTHCANGHRWTVATTRWRIRTDKGETSPTRDCLTCKAVSEAKRKRTRVAERRYL